MKRVKKRIFSGTVCEQLVYNIPDFADPRTYKKRVRFSTAEEYIAFKDRVALRKFIRLVNANHDPSSFKCTFTFNSDYEIYEFDDGRRMRSVYVRRLRRRYPDAKIIVVMGQHKKSGKIHFHAIIGGVPRDVILEQWTWGKIKECEPLREHNIYDGVDRGRDYTALAEYYWKNWTPEQGGHHYYATRNHEKPQEEPAEEVKREYSKKNPPRAPKGYVLAKAETTPFGFLHFIYIIPPKKRNYSKKDASQEE
ncbi:MAG: hypothetical protein IKB87_04965 [Clostridia bacterium]|nr:hypothetical protein [Clostridia bacterium]